MIQVVVLLALMFVYDKQTVYLLLFLPCYAGVVLYLVSDLPTSNVLSTLQTSVIPMMLLSRVSIGSPEAKVFYYEGLLLYKNTTQESLLTNQQLWHLDVGVGNRNLQLSLFI